MYITYVSTSDRRDRTEKIHSTHLLLRWGSEALEGSEVVVSGFIDSYGREAVRCIRLSIQFPGGAKGERYRKVRRA